MVPTMFVRLLKLPDKVRNRHDLSSLKFVAHAAAPCPPEVKRRMIEWWGPVINEYYGGTETGATTFHNSQKALAKHGTVGRTMKNCEVVIRDEDGYLFICNRVKDMEISGGVNIYPAEIEVVPIEMLGVNDW